MGSRLKEEKKNHRILKNSTVWRILNKLVSQKYGPLSSKTSGIAFNTVFKQHQSLTIFGETLNLVLPKAIHMVYAQLSVMKVNDLLDFQTMMIYCG